MFDFQDITVVTAVVMGLSEVAKKLGLNAKIVPIFNLVVGVVAGCVYMNPGDLKAGVFSGVIVGLSASGLYSGAKNVIQEITKDKEQ